MPDKPLSTEQRTLVIARAQGCCEYCRSQARFATQAFSIEHIIPRSKGGETTVHNLALSCQGCNNHKAHHSHQIGRLGGPCPPYRAGLPVR